MACALLGGSGPARQRITIGIAIDNDITRAFEIPAVDLDITGNQKPRAAVRPAPIQRFQRGRGVHACIGEAFRHRRLGDSVG